jgi:hypothetical protein
MSNISLIKSFYLRVRSLFNQAVLRLEVKEYSNTYIVDVAPLDVYKDDKYIELEKSFRDKFEVLNPNASILFVSENSLVRADESNLKLDLQYKSILMENAIQHTLYANQDHSFMDNYSNYALAA